MRNSSIIVSRLLGMPNPSEMLRTTLTALFLKHGKPLAAVTPRQTVWPYLIYTILITFFLASAMIWVKPASFFPQKNVVAGDNQYAVIASSLIESCFVTSCTTSRPIVIIRTYTYTHSQTHASLFC